MLDKRVEKSLKQLKEKLESNKEKYAKELDVDKFIDNLERTLLIIPNSESIIGMMMWKIECVESGSTLSFRDFIKRQNEYLEKDIVLEENKKISFKEKFKSIFKKKESKLGEYTENFTNYKMKQIEIFEKDQEIQYLRDRLIIETTKREIFNEEIMSKFPKNKEIDKSKMVYPSYSNQVKPIGVFSCECENKGSKED